MKKIDLVKDKLITFAELAEAIPGRNGRPVAVSSVHRWRHPGLKGGIRLEAVRTGGIWRTTWPAFRAFVECCTAAHDGQQSSDGEHDSRDAEAAEEQLDAGNW